MAGKTQTDHKKTVIFDMDGLMFDSERLCIQAYDYAGEKYGVGKLGYLVVETLGMNHEASQPIWKKYLGEDYDAAGIRRYVDEFYDDFHKNHKMPVKKGLYHLLEYLDAHGYDMAVASSTSTKTVIANLKEAGIFGYFKVVIGGDQLRASKPSPDIYLMACEKLGRSPKECYALEDSRNGVLSASSAGCMTIMVPDIWQPDDEFLARVHQKFEDLDQVRDYFEKKDLEDGE